MPVCRLMLLAVVAAGCTRPHARQQPPRPTALPDPAPMVPVPTPPSPPPLAPTPPPLPAVSDTPGLPDPTAQPTSYSEGSDADDSRRQERQKRRQDRREERREGPAKPPEPAPASPPTGTHATGSPAADADAVRALVDAAAARWATVPDFEARLVKREVANGRVIPQNEVLYRYRQSPHSVYMRVLAGPGEGREVLYVQGRFGDKMHVITGKGDNALVGAGFKTELDPHDKQATAKSRYKVTEAGFGRVISGLRKQVAVGDVMRAKLLKGVSRPEYPYPLDGVEGTFGPGEDPLLPKGGTRQVFFDVKPESPGYRLPVLVVAKEPNDREVEYYSFDRLKVPSGLTDADWHPDRLKRR
jgi:hypothetical protein